MPDYRMREETVEVIRILRRKEAFGRGRPVESDENIDIARVRGFVARGRPEDGDSRDGKLLPQGRFMPSQERGV